MKIPLSKLFIIQMFCSPFITCCKSIYVSKNDIMWAGGSVSSVHVGAVGVLVRTGLDLESMCTQNLGSLPLWRSAGQLSTAVTHDTFELFSALTHKYTCACAEMPSKKTREPQVHDINKQVSFGAAFAGEAVEVNRPLLSKYRQAQEHQVCTSCVQRKTVFAVDE